MKQISLLVLFGSITLLLSSCNSGRSAVRGYQPYRIYNSSVYDDAPGAWDVYQSRNSTRVKYTE